MFNVSGFSARKPREGKTNKNIYIYKSSVKFKKNVNKVES